MHGRMVRDVEYPMTLLFRATVVNSRWEEVMSDGERKEELQYRYCSLCNNCEITHAKIADALAC